MLGAICIICALHNLKTIDATEWYVNFTMVLLPINSVINPLLYDNTLREFLSSILHDMMRIINNSRLAVYIRQTCYENERIVDNIEMDVVSAPKPRSQESNIEPAYDNRSVQETPALQTDGTW